MTDVGIEPTACQGTLRQASLQPSGAPMPVRAMGGSGEDNNNNGNNSNNCNNTNNTNNCNDSNNCNNSNNGNDCNDCNDSLIIMGGSEAFKG